MTSALDEDRASAAARVPVRRRGRVVVAVLVVAVGVGLVFGYEAWVVFEVPTHEAVATAAVPIVAELEPQRASTDEHTGTTGGAGEQRATGRVVIDYHDRTSVFGCLERGDCPPAEVVLPAGTRVATCAEPGANFATTPCRRPDIVFVTQAPLRITTNTRAEVAIRAVEPGTRGNVRYAAIEHLIDAPQFPHAEVTVWPSPETTGGTDVASGIVAQADVDRVVRKHETALRAAAERRLRDHAEGRGLAAVLTAMDIETEVEPPVGSSAQSVRVSVEAVARGVGYEADRLRDAAERALSATLPPGQHFVPGSVTVLSPTPRGSDVVVEARARSSEVDPAAVRSQLARRWTASARSALEDRHGRDHVRLDGRPMLLPFGPFLTSRVRVTIDT